MQEDEHRASGQKVYCVLQWYALKSSAVYACNLVNVAAEQLRLRQTFLQTPNNIFMIC